MSEEGEYREFVCWKCKFLLFLYKCKIKVVINCPRCKIENRAGVGSGKETTAAAG